MPRRVAQRVLALGGRAQPVGVGGLDVELRCALRPRGLAAEHELGGREPDARRRDRFLEADLARIGAGCCGRHGLGPPRGETGQPGLGLASPGFALLDDPLDQLAAPFLAARPVAGKLGVRRVPVSSVVLPAAHAVFSSSAGAEDEACPRREQQRRRRQGRLLQAAADMNKSAIAVAKTVKRVISRPCPLAFYRFS